MKILIAFLFVLLPSFVFGDLLKDTFGLELGQGKFAARFTLFLHGFKETTDKQSEGTGALTFSDGELAGEKGLKVQLIFNDDRLFMGGISFGTVKDEQAVQRFKSIEKMVESHNTKARFSDNSRFLDGTRSHTDVELVDGIRNSLAKVDCSWDWDRSGMQLMVTVDPATGTGKSLSVTLFFLSGTYAPAGFAI